MSGLLALGACSASVADKPVTWWHEAEGGKIAEQRPPPPGDADPFPNLATVPARPPPADAAAWNRLTAGLTADRIAARQVELVVPLAVPAAQSPSPPSGNMAPPGNTDGHPHPADQGAEEPGASAALEAITRPPAERAKAPPASKASSAAQPTGSSDGPRPASPPGAGTGTQAGEDSIALADAAQMVLPPLPTQEPPRPDFAPGPPPQAGIAVAPPREPPRPPGAPSVEFSPGSAELDQAALDLVASLAETRSGHAIAVTGYGDTASSDPLAQSAALDLALRRAQVLATALVARGVPYASLRIDAEAAGRGASLRLLQ